MPETQNSSRESLEVSGRRFLTFLVVSISVVGVVLLGITAIALPGNDRFERLKFVTATVLPVIASWVGTIMAFYFSKENFMAATQSVSSQESRN